MLVKALLVLFPMTFRYLSLLILSSFFAPQLSGQELLEGIIYDANNREGLSGVKIQIDNGQAGTFTDSLGRFQIRFNAYPLVLDISLPSYVEARVNLEEQPTPAFSFGLVPAFSLQEKIPQAFQALPYQALTHAPVSVPEARLRQGVFHSVADRLIGTAAGLLVSRSGDGPNDRPEIRLRGLTGLGNERLSPLVVVDGVPGASLETIDPDDIRRVTVLKDAAAAALYGIRAANGVLLVETQLPEENIPTQISYQSVSSIELRSRKIPVLSAAEYRSLPGSNDLGSANDFQDLTTRDAFSHLHHLRLSGSNSRIQYRGSLHYREVQGLSPNSEYQQYNGRFFLRHQAWHNRLQIEAQLAANQRDAQRVNPNVFEYAATFNPTAPVRLEGPEFEKYGGYFQQYLFHYYNPVALLAQQQQEEKYRHLFSQVNGQLKLRKGLKVKTRFAWETGSILGGSWFSKYDFNLGQNFNGLARREQQNREMQYWENTLHYVKSGPRFSLRLLLGLSWQREHLESFFAEGSDFLLDRFLFHNLGAANAFDKGLGDVGSNAETHLMAAYFGNAHLQWRDFLFLDLALRREGSSRLGNNQRWAQFPGASLALDLAQWLSWSRFQQVKLRGGWGMTGNLPNQAYLSQTFLQQFGPYFYFNGNYIRSTVVAQAGNPELSAPQNREWNLGLDLTWENQRVRMSVNYFQQTAVDLIQRISQPVPPNLLDFKYDNVGSFRQSGLELSGAALLSARPGFRWEMTLQHAWLVRNEILDLGLNTDFIVIASPGSPGGGGGHLIRVGSGLAQGSLYGFEVRGVDQNGYWQYRDQNGDEFISEDDKVLVGRALPRHYFGLHNQIDLNRWTLSFQLEGALGHQIFNLNRLFYESAEIVNTYNQVRSSKFNPRVNDYNQVSDHFAENASYLRLGFMQLQYLLREKSPVPITLSLSSQNLFTLTGYTGMSPSVRLSDPLGSGNPLAMGIDRRASYPVGRRFSLGVKFVF
jgi:TonB-linked SusC/RagA family outer membrane protein